MKTFNKLILSVIFVSLFIGAKAQTTVSQIIASNQTWTASGSPYIVSQNVLVKNGAKVFVKPGTKIRGTGNFKIIMEEGAGFEAVGNKDSVIRIDTVKFEFLKKSVDYDFSSKSGSQFSYCSFIGNGVTGYQTIILFETNMYIGNCKFFNTYNTVYDNGNSEVSIEKSTFDWKKFDYGYAYYGSGSSGSLRMDLCEVKNSYGFYLPAVSTVTRCYFYNWVSNSGIRGGQKTTFKCNTFRKFRFAIMELSGGAKNEVIIVSNTFDSSETHIDYYVTGMANAKFICKNNNFLHYTKSSINVRGGVKPGYADTLVFTKNYWNTSSVSAIKTAIWDIKDDITIGGLVDFANYHTTLVSDCIEDDSKEEFVGGENSGNVNRINSIKFGLYPNPATQMITISSTTSLTHFQIFSLTGELIKEGDFSNTNQSIDVSELQNGLFVIEVIDDKNRKGVQKLTISR